MIKTYVARYVVPFYFDYKNNGYTKILDFFRNHAEIKNQKLGLPKDCCWTELGFWENYKSENSKQFEMDIYTFLLQIFEEYHENDTKYETNLGVSFVLKTNGTLFKLQYKGIPKEKFIGLRCNDLGVLFFRNGIGFIWYDIEFSKIPSVQNYLKFQHDFKELARTHSEKFIKKIGRDSCEIFCMGKWLADVINTKQLGISFWAERETAVEDNTSSKFIPDKALMFQYLFIDEMDSAHRNDLAFKIANGYNTKYKLSNLLVNEIYEPFGNACFYTSKAGTAYVVSNSDSNEAFFMNNFKKKFVGDYFFIYILLLYQTYSCSHYSRLLTKLPAKTELFEENMQYVNDLEMLNIQINLFLVKSVYETVSNIQHQNEMYKYGKRALLLEEDINSLTIGLSALREIEKEKAKDLEEKKEKVEQEKVERKDRMLNRGLAVVGSLTVVSVVLDALNLVDWFDDNISNINMGHILLLVIILISTLLATILLIISIRKK